MDIVLLGAAFVGGCFAGGFINHWMVSSGITKGLSNLEASIGSLKATVAAKLPTTPVKVVPVTTTTIKQDPTVQVSKTK